MSLPLNLSAYRAALEQARLDLSGNVFKEDLHPRIHGKFAKKVGALKPGESIRLPDGYGVRREQSPRSPGEKASYVVDHKNSGGAVKSITPDPKFAAKDALNWSARHNHKDSVGGTDRYDSFDAFKADPEHARQDKIDAKQKERLERSKQAGHGPGDMHSAIRNLMRAGAAGTLSADTQIDVEGFNAALAQARADQGIDAPADALELAVFDPNKHPRLRGRFVDVLNKVHPEHADAVAREIHRTEDFQGANNHVHSVTHDPSTGTVTIHYNQKRTFFHNEIGGRVNALKPGTGDGGAYESQIRQGRDGTEMTKEVPVPDHVPHGDSIRRVLSKGEQATLRNAMLSSNRPQWQIDRHYKALQRFEGGKHTDADIQDAQGALRSYASRMKGKPSESKARALHDRLETHKQTVDLQSAVQDVIGNRRIQIEDITPDTASFTLPGGDDEYHDYTIDRASDSPWVVTQAHPDQFILTELPLDAYDDEADNYDAELLTHHVLDSKDILGALNEALNVPDIKARQAEPHAPDGVGLAVFEERLHPRLRGKFTKKIGVNDNHPDGGRGRTNDVRDQLKSLPVGGVGVLPSGVAVHRKEDKHFQVFKPDGTEVTTKAGAKTPHQAADNALLSHDFHESMKPIDHVRVVMEGAGLKPAGGRMTNPTFHKPVEVEGKGGKGAINATKQGNVSWSFENKHGKYTSGHEPDAATAIEKIKAHASASKEGEPKLDGTTFDRSPFEGPGRERAIQEELARLDNTDAVSFGRRLGNLSRDSGVPITELRSKARKRFAKPDASGDHAGDAIHVGSDVNKAADLLSQGKHVVLDQPKHASVLLDELAKRVNAAKEKGDAAPNIDLCKVTVKNSNLFCAESKGIPRVKMPQLKGVPTPGSKADRLAKNDKGEVDLSTLFREQLKHEGVKIEDTTEKAANLRASQIELNGAKVAGMTKALEAGKNLGNDPLFTSHDNYIVDGHHRWAANVGHDIADNVAGDISMPIARIDMDIIELLDASNKFASEWGIPQASVAATKPGDK